MSGAPLHFYPSRDVGTTQRLPSTSVLAINSEDRFKDLAESRLSRGAPGSNPLKQNPYSFLITKNESIMNGFFTRLGLTEVVLPWVIPNINGKTDKIRILYDISGGASGEEYILLESGFYRPAELATALQTAVRDTLSGIDARFADFTVIYGYLNIPSFLYSTEDPELRVAFLPVPTNLDPAAPFNESYIYDAANTRQLFDVLGFTAPSNTSLKESESGGITFCQAIDYVDVVCTQLTSNQALKDTMSQQIARDVLCRIYITGNDVNNVPPSSANFCPPGCAPFTVYRNFSQPKQIQWLPNQPVQSSLQFDLFDDMGNPLSDSLPSYVADNRTNWSFTILVSEN
jgi:hypothetical protein